MTSNVARGADYAAQVATEKGKVDLDEMILIGTFGTDTGRRALVRLSSGRIEKVEPGERLRGATVVSIGTDVVVLKAGSGTRRLEMPAG